MAVTIVPQFRRDLTYFLVGPAAISLVIAGLYHLHPWPTSLRAQAQNFEWQITGWWMVVGAIGVALSSHIGCPPAPPVSDGPAWRRLIAWSFGLGVLQGAVSVAKNMVPALWAHYQALDRAAGFTWGNVGLPWSIPHYLHASVLSECFFRFGLIAIPVWLISTLLLKDRFQAPIFWIFALFSALIEPLENILLVKHVSLAKTSLIDAESTLEGIAWELAYAWVFRRFGWPAPILMRFGWYALFRVTAGYFFPPGSTMYPGPH